MRSFKNLFWLIGFAFGCYACFSALFDKNGFTAVVAAAVGVICWNNFVRVKR